jgi:hypothetical protein
LRSIVCIDLYPLKSMNEVRWRRARYKFARNVCFFRESPWEIPYAGAYERRESVCGCGAHRGVLPLTPTRQSIERALVEWMTQTGRPASDLSVSALCKKAFVARSTFYANYRHMGQVYESVENRPAAPALRVRSADARACRRHR